MSQAVPAKRYLIAVGVDDPGDNARLPRLSGVANDLRRMRELFVDGLGYEAVTLGVSDSLTDNLNLSAEQVRTGLIAWRQRIKLKPARSVVFYFSGHAMARGDDLYLCTRNFDHTVLASGLDARSIGHSLDRASPQVWVILDVCFAATGTRALAQQAAQLMASESAAYWFLASSGGRVPSHDGVLSRAFVNAARVHPHSHEGFIAAVSRGLEEAAAAQRVMPTTTGHGVFDLLLSDAGAIAEAGRLSRVPSRMPWRPLLLALGGALLVPLLWSMRGCLPDLPSAATAESTNLPHHVLPAPLIEAPPPPVPLAPAPQPKASASTEGARRPVAAANLPVDPRRAVAAMQRFYKDLNAGTFDAHRYFAPEIERYIQMTNTTPDKINNYILGYYQRQYRDALFAMEPDSLAPEGAPGEYVFIERSRFIRVRDTAYVRSRHRVRVRLSADFKMEFFRQFEPLETYKSMTGWDAGSPADAGTKVP